MGDTRATVVSKSAAGDPDVQRRVFHINELFDQEMKEPNLHTNRVTTTKYTCFTFLPKNLFLQFTKMANAYFLMMVIIQLIPSLATVFQAMTTLAPLVFVVAISMIKDGYEDRQRAKQDDAENNLECQAASRGST